MEIRDERFKAGDWLAVCDRCGFAYRNTQIRREWTGLMVCAGPGTNDCWEPRHPQEFTRSRLDRQAVAWTAPVPADIYIGDGEFADGDVFNGRGASDTNPDTANSGTPRAFNNQTAYGGSAS